MLSSLQQQVAAIVSGLEEADGFALAGGAALIARGEVERRTRTPGVFVEMLGGFRRLRRESSTSTTSGTGS